MTIEALPAVNAVLNGTSAILLGLGYGMIRRKRVRAHWCCMVAALVVSTLFLGSYLYYHANVEGMTRFRDPAWFRPIYLLILVSHTILAMVLLPLVVVTVWWAVRGRFERHRAIARWTWPIWMYVSVTGVMIYLFLYQIFPQR